MNTIIYMYIHIYVYIYSYTYTYINMTFITLDIYHMRTVA